MYCRSYIYILAKKELFFWACFNLFWPIYVFWYSMEIGIIKKKSNRLGFKKCIVGYLFTYAIVSKLMCCLFCPLPKDYGKND